MIVIMAGVLMTAVDTTGSSRAILVGTTSLHGSLASAFTTGAHTAFYESAFFMVLAAILSALRGGPGRKRRDHDRKGRDRIRPGRADE
jgi:hypothetical protein